jgi:hypothetical protein
MHFAVPTGRSFAMRGRRAGGPEGNGSHELRTQSRGLKTARSRRRAGCRKSEGRCESAFILEGTSDEIQHCKEMGLGGQDSP